MENLMESIAESLTKTLCELETRKKVHEKEYEFTMRVFEDYKKDLALLKNASENISRDQKYDMKKFLIQLMDIDRDICTLIKAFNIS